MITKINKNWDNSSIKFWDPFAGGGAIPLEAERLGLKVYASDLNPVACLILEATLKFPQKLGMVKLPETQLTKIIKTKKEKLSISKSILGELIRKWGKWLIDNAKPEVDKLYYFDEKGIPSVYFWIHTVPCSNCGKKMPLSKMTYISSRKNKDQASILELEKNQSKGTFKGKIKLVKKGTEGFPKQERLTGSQGTTKCLFCKQILKGDIVRERAKEGKMEYLPVAKMVLKKKNKNQYKKIYLPLDEKDLSILSICEEKEKILDDFYIPIPEYSGRGLQRGIGSPRIYGITSFKDFFVPRQRLIIAIISKWINKAREALISQENEETGNIVSLYLTFALTKFLEFNGRYSLWLASEECPMQVARAYAYNLSWDFPEIYPFKPGGFSYNSKIQDIARVIDKIAKINPNVQKIWQHNASEKSFLEDNSIDIIFTDPPYYGTMDYAGIADFFYGLMKKSQAKAFPQYFKDLVTPKAQECVLQIHRFKTENEAKKSYEKHLTEAFKEMNRVLKSEGLFIIVFAHIDLSAWEAIISALIEANFQITACWPINTESTTGAQKGKAVLSATMHLICRKRRNISKAIFFQDLKKELDIILVKHLKKLWNLGFSGASLDIAMLGPAFELFGNYRKIEDERTGKEISIKRWLEYTQKKVLQLQLSEVMENFLQNDQKSKLSSMDTFTQFYILYRLEFGDKPIEIDALRLLEKATNLNLNKLIQWGYLEKNSTKIILRYAEERLAPEDLINNKPHGEIISLIDTLHGAVLAHQRGLFSDYEEKESIDHKHPLWVLAQLIANLLPANSKEAISLKNFMNLRKLRAKSTVSLDSFFKKKKN